jgi:hypothetical protein
MGQEQRFLESVGIRGRSSGVQEFEEFRRGARSQNPGARRRWVGHIAGRNNPTERLKPGAICFKEHV